VDGWQEAVADRATTYVTEPTWERLFRRHGRRRCRLLADIADAILTGKRKMHDLVGWSAGWLLGLLGAGALERQVARELASKIPLPPDAKLIATARGVQVTGVVVCLSAGEDLARCQCFIDLSLSEAKTRVKALLIAATEDWRGFAEFPPKDGPLAR